MLLHCQSPYWTYAGRREVSVMIRTACLIAALCVTATAAADVFKYVDEKGQVQYTDRPEKLPAELVMRGTTSRREIVEIDMRDEAEGDGAVERDQARQQADKAKATQKKDSAAIAEGKADACNKARQDYLTKMNSQRL